MNAKPDVRRLLLLLALLAVVAGAAVVWRRPASGPSPAAMREAERLLPQLLALEAREDQVAQTVWAKELLAQRCGRRFEQLWDACHATTNPLAVVIAWPVGELLLPEFKDPEALGHGIELRAPRPPDPEGASAPAARTLSLDAWRDWLVARQSDGWALTQLEFRHHRFDVDGAGQPAQSEFGFRAHAVRAHPQERAALEGDLVVDWAPAASGEEPVTVRRVDARRVSLKTRAGPPAFRRVLLENVRPPEKSHFIDPLLLHDLDGDGRSEIVLAAANRVYRLLSGDRFEAGDLCMPPPGLIFTAILADLDGAPGDDLVSVRFEGLYLVSGRPDGGFVPPVRHVWRAPQRIRYGQALTCGDVDGDGDLDVWLGQYRNPYDRGQMPVPYYDANDGYPAYLLRNDGRGNFTDVTEAAGLAAKRWRRTYAASLVDLDDDADLDLAVVSDFAGVEVYANDGRGRFTTATHDRLTKPRAFGMAHTFADFDRDGRLDWFVTGMHCPTASRLIHLGLSRPDRPDYLAMAPEMVAGNKLLLAQADGRFVNVATDVGVARSGWSWGCAAADFDNDGWPDLAIANGHETRRSVEEYEPQFWLHDLYVADSQENPVVATYFAAKINRLRGGGGLSYGGWEQNRLFLNRGPVGFAEVAHLLGVALTEDSRNLAADDLDGDGRVDLVLTTFEVWPERRQTLQVFRNELPATGNWLGVRLRDPRGGRSPVGAKVTVRSLDQRVAVRHLVTGDSHRAQHPSTLRFGLGLAGGVESVAVRWPHGRETTVPQPALNRVIELVAPPD